MHAHPALVARHLQCGMRLQVRDFIETAAGDRNVAHGVFGGTSRRLIYGSVVRFSIVTRRIRVRLSLRTGYGRERTAVRRMLQKQPVGVGE